MNEKTNSSTDIKEKWIKNGKNDFKLKHTQLVAIFLFVLLLSELVFVLFLDFHLDKVRLLYEGVDVMSGSMYLFDRMFQVLLACALSVERTQFLQNSYQTGISRLL